MNENGFYDRDHKCHHGRDHVTNTASLVLVRLYIFYHRSLEVSLMSQSSPPQPTQTLDQSVSDLELRVAYHERLNQDLSDQVYALHREVDKLRAQLQALMKRLAQDKGQLEVGPADDPPPHY